MPRRRPMTQRRRKRSMIGGADFEKFQFMFKVGFEPDTTNSNVVDDKMVKANAEKLVDLIQKRLAKAIENNIVNHVRNVEIQHIEKAYFQITCEIDKDEVDFPDLHILYSLEKISGDKFDNQIRNVPELDVHVANENNEAANEINREFAKQLAQHIKFSEVDETLSSYNARTARKNGASARRRRNRRSTRRNRRRNL